VVCDSCGSCCGWLYNNITNHNNMNHCYHKPQTVMDNNITNHNNMNHCYHKPQTVMDNNITNHNNIVVVVSYIVVHYCLRLVIAVVHVVVVSYIVVHYCLWFVIAVVHVVVSYIASNSNGQQYN
jgi:hypothetical protein